MRCVLLLVLFAATFAALWLLMQPKDVDLERYAQDSSRSNAGGREYTPQRPGPPDRSSPRPIEQEQESARSQSPQPPPRIPPAPDAPLPPPLVDTLPPPPTDVVAEPNPNDPKLHKFPPIEKEGPREIDLRWWLDHGATWFLEPIPALVDAPPPSTFKCENTPDFGPLLLIAVFSTAKGWEKRDLIRVLGRQGLGPAIASQVLFRFVVGRTNDKESEDRLQLEIQRYGDILQLEFPENMDEGKTYQFLRWVGERPESERPRFAMKTDDDTFLVLPNLLSVISSLDCSQNIYFGTSWGACITDCYPFYMRGMAYGLSWPLIRWLTTASLSFDDYRSTEDARTGSWFLSLPATEKMYVVDLERRLGDWDGISIPVNSGTVALHAMKSNWLWAKVGLQLMDTWEKEEKEYMYNGERSRKGRELPEGEEGGEEEQDPEP
ncbi:hypothetical protein DACRYDRAFT_14925 [Dacryopinax primogenitus]|uniref:Hexosyltransferase n=1 Tax=Dacryopinax primogenitus (strain DJM 731) TaxID=1858805 RepID=M5G2N4_DACPD|nr:uncharacterized protein DACRYDRAFT_14925 [Dacryopinax primogenitus]EJU02954.1 hypothetical protein DACRYDRAFT_14925 [Dacryopinax primogenitus]